MKKLIITCALLSASAIVSFGQSTQTTTTTSMQQPQGQSPAMAPANPHMPPAEMIAEKRAKMYEKQLGLSADQYKGIYEAELYYWKQEMGARANGGQPGPGQTMQNQMAKDQKFKNVLTADQYAKYSATAPKPSPTPAPLPNTTK